MNANFYRAFEDLHRGSRELIRKRQEAYLPFINPLKTLYPQCPAFDLGCGRGEWLELILSQGFLARGVDLDEGMLQACQALDLPAEYGDALTALSALEDESQVVVSAFHLVEHIPFSCLQQLVSEALRVLKPAGLLIMETPNPENLLVGTNFFYLDPTHEKPIPHSLLSFLTEFTGFARSKLVRLQEPAALHDVPQLTLMEVFSGVSPDYAIIAQKTALDEQMAVFDPCFDRNYGLSLESLAERYEQSMEQRLRVMVESHRIQELQQTRQLRDEALAQAHELWLQSCTDQSRIQALMSSTSWRVTAPLRWCVRSVRWVGSRFKRLIKGGARRIVVVGLRHTLGRPGLRRQLNAVLKRYPRLYEPLKRFAQTRGLMATHFGPANSSLPQHLEGLSAGARQVYYDLEKTIEQKDHR
ncbi:methyltransferase domain-containing protein [Pseudomonas azerbaijanoccidentalis]|jgi:O-antigen chain-terminating methyltransferase